MTDGAKGHHTSLWTKEKGALVELDITKDSLWDLATQPSLQRDLKALLEKKKIK